MWCLGIILHWDNNLQFACSCSKVCYTMMTKFAGIPSLAWVNRKSVFCIEWNVIKANHKGLFGIPESLSLLMYFAIVNDCLMRHFQKLNISYYKVAPLKRGNFQIIRAHIKNINNLYRAHIISKSSFDKNINNLWYKSNFFFFFKLRIFSTDKQNADCRLVSQCMLEVITTRV